MGTFDLSVLTTLLVLVIDLVWVVLVLLALLPVKTFFPPAYAVLKRNFRSYFSTPTGYVFLCMFVTLTSFAAFWPHEFFNANLANLDQLNGYFVLIMLVFIPAVTMSLWAEERKQGTDELLLTLPATDFDIVLGKYLAAASIFSVSLLFSQVSHFIVLSSLTEGMVDIQLLLTVYIGYWLVGLAMVAIGMLASFITSNLTVGFILGAMFNAPLVFLTFADVIVPSSAYAQIFSSWSLEAKFEDFGRGVISGSGLIYFLSITIFGVLVSYILVSQRRLKDSPGATSRVGHLLTRGAALFVIFASANILMASYDFIRVDMTEKKVNSLSSSTIALLKELKPNHKIKIKAYLSEEVPREYTKTKNELLGLLKEFRVLAGGEIEVEINDNLTIASDKAVEAENLYQIRPIPVQTRSHGKSVNQSVVLGAAVISGLEREEIPFFDYGMSVEHELVRAIVSVSQENRKLIGIVKTDAKVMGGLHQALNPQGGTQTSLLPRQLIVSELEKKYDVESVDLSSPVPTDKYDVLLAVQPSLLSQEQMDNLLVAVGNGQPTAIFEDPQPVVQDPFRGGTGFVVPGTAYSLAKEFSVAPVVGVERQWPIYQLWELLKIKPVGTAANQQGIPQASSDWKLPDIIWLDYNPYPKLQHQEVTPEWIFVRKNFSVDEDFFNAEHPATFHLQEVLLPTPGAITPMADSITDFQALVTTSRLSGRLRILDYGRFLRREIPNLNTSRGRPQGQPFTLAAQITTLPSELAEDEKLNVIYVADIDLLNSFFFSVQARPAGEVKWRFENAAFVLNLIDVLAGDERFCEIRRSRYQNETLRVVESQVQMAQQEIDQQISQFTEEREEKIAAVEREIEKELVSLDEQEKALQQRYAQGEEIDPEELERLGQQRVQQQVLVQNRKANATKEMERKYQRQIEATKRDLEIKKATIQNSYKFWAILLPPIPPLVVALVVYLRKRLWEREGISRLRLKEK
ncbi:MAG: Gldg family protein [Pirellulaceae bacterium]|nr:Gldg family protein [Pirellulaceae bacterium]